MAITAMQSLGLGAASSALNFLGSKSLQRSQGKQDYENRVRWYEHLKGEGLNPAEIAGASGYPSGAPSATIGQANLAGAHATVKAAQIAADAQVKTAEIQSDPHHRKVDAEWERLRIEKGRLNNEQVRTFLEGWRTQLEDELTKGRMATTLNAEQRLREAVARAGVPGFAREVIEAVLGGQIGSFISDHIMKPLQDGTAREQVDKGFTRVMEWIDEQMGVSIDRREE